MPTFGERLRFLRKIHKETQKQVGELIGLSRSAISRYENDVALPMTKDIVILAEHYHVRVDYIVGKDNRLFEAGEEYAFDKKIPLISEKTALALPEYIATEAIGFIPFERNDADEDVFAVKVVSYGMLVTLAAKRRYNKGEIVLCNEDNKLLIKNRKEIAGRKIKIVGTILDFID